MILADTKYEFGVTADDEVLLIDEVHTPDSSRYWVADDVRASASPPATSRRAWTKRWCAGRWPTVGTVATVILPRSATRSSPPPPTRYIDAYERLTGEPFERGDYPVDERIAARLDDILAEYRRCVVSRELPSLLRHRCERVSASERAASNRLRGRGTH